MANQRLIHDAALMMAQAILKTVSPCLREEEKLEALSEFYIVCKAGIESYSIQEGRMLKRLDPTRN